VSKILTLSGLLIWTLGAQPVWPATACSECSRRACMAEAAKTLHIDKEIVAQVLSKYLRIEDRKVLDLAYNAEIKALEPRMELKLEAVQAILDDLAQIDPRAKKFKPQELYDRRYLDELEKSGFLAKLWVGTTPR